MKVWVVESGDYEQRGIDLIAESVEAAVAALKARYGSPYIVEWGEIEERSGVTQGNPWRELTLKARHSHVPGYAVGHTNTYTFSEWDVAAGVPVER